MLQNLKKRFLWIDINFNHGFQICDIGVQNWEKMKNLIFLFINFLLLSCSKNKIEKVLLENNTCWELGVIDGNETKPIGNYCFEDNKKYLYFDEIGHDKNKIFEQNKSYLRREEEWYLKYEDSLYMNDYGYKIIRYNKDTLWLRNSNYYFLFIKLNNVGSPNLYNSRYL